MAPNFRTGSEVAEEAAKRPNFSRVGFLNIEDGHHVTVRMLTDHDSLITVEQHNNASTRDAPKDFDGKWPTNMGAVCRNDTAFDYPDCYLCIMLNETGDKRKYKASSRSWGLGVIRKPKMVDGRQVGMEDSMLEVEIDGKTTKVPEVVMLNFAWSNFWAGFATIKDMYQTWCDRDIMIRRSGTELNTTYTMQAWPPITLDGTPAVEGSPDMLDTRKPDIAVKYLAPLGISGADFTGTHQSSAAAAFMSALGELVAARADDEFYARFFDVRVSQPATKKADDDAKSTPAEEAVVKPSNDPSPEELAALAARIQGHPGAAESDAGGSTPLSFDTN